MNSSDHNILNCVKFAVKDEIFYFIQQNNEHLSLCIVAI